MNNCILCLIKVILLNYQQYEISVQCSLLNGDHKQGMKLMLHSVERDPIYFICRKKKTKIIFFTEIFPFYNYNFFFSTKKQTL